MTDRAPVEPVMTKRDGNRGWMASTPPEYPLRFAVIGADESDAKDKFQTAVERWEAIPRDSTEVSPS